MKPMTNSEIAAQARETEKKFGVQSNGTGSGSVSQSYTFGHYQVVWAQNLAEVRDAAACDTVVFRGTKDECVAWAKLAAATATPIQLGKFHYSQSECPHNWCGGYCDLCGAVKPV